MAPKQKIRVFVLRKRTEVNNTSKVKVHVFAVFLWHSEGWSERHETVMEAASLGFPNMESKLVSGGCWFQQKLWPLVGSCIFGVRTDQCPWRPRVARIAQMLLISEVARKTGRSCHMSWKAVQQCRMSQFLFGKSSNGATQTDLLDVGWYND